MADFFYRTEDIKPDEVAQYFVETKRDREIINLLKARNPVILVGSRGVGKSFLIRVAEHELRNELATSKVLPVYVSFTRSSLINTNDPQQFQHWMLARICARLHRTLSSSGFVGGPLKGISILAGGQVPASPADPTKLEALISKYEDSWQTDPVTIDASAIPSVEDFRDAIEDICSDFGLSRIVLLIDEAAHILLPEQQRQFFTLFRDLRSPYLSSKAAVYPGVTSYGDTFQPTHDATMLTFERDTLGAEYVDTMREIVEKQAESSMLADIARHDKNFALLAFAANGNPRVLLKTLARAPKLGSTETNAVIREYYRSDLWSEHSTLPDKYPGHQHLIDWGRQFIEGNVLPDLQRKNVQYLAQDKQTTAFFWIHRDAPQPVKEALKLLAYTGIVSEHSSGIRASRNEIGTRYAVNLGALMSLEATPTTTGLPIARSLTPKRMIEFGANHPSYQTLLDAVPTFSEPAVGAILKHQLAKAVDVLDISDWQKEKLKEAKICTVGEVLLAGETKLQTLSYVGEKRSRRIKNAALAAVFEYLSG